LARFSGACIWSTWPIRPDAGLRPGWAPARVRGRAYGYQPVKGEPGELELVEEEAEIVRRIFRDYGSGMGLRKIAARLNADGVASPRANVWMANTLVGSAERQVGILRCDLYRGKRVWNKLRYLRDPDTGSDVPALRLVTDAQWRAVAERLARRKQGTRGRPAGTARQPRFLSGLITCGVCGSSMVIGGRDRMGDRVVCCRHQGGKACGHGRQYYLDKIEAVVTQIVAEFMRDKAHMDSFADAFIASHRSDGVDAAKRRKQAAAALLRAQNALNRVLDQYEEGVIEKPAMLERSARWKAEAASAQASLVEIPPAPDTDDHQAAARAYAYADAMQNLAKLLNKGDAGAARDELRKLIDSVTLFPTEPYKPYNIEVRGPVVALNLVAGACNGLYSHSPLMRISA
jgi:site-specific DNA recombinase